jgi:large subunit ribosomal protein L4
MELPLRNAQGEVTGTVEVSETLFDQPMNQALVHQAVVMYQSNKRTGTHSTKTRAEVSGGGRKPWPQKHTGRARQGSTRSPQWRHGGVAFGPKPRSYRKDMPRRMRHQALRCVLSEKARSGKLVLVEGLTVSAARTKEMVALLQTLGASRSTLIVTREPDTNVVRSAHNIDKVWTLPVRLLNAYELLRRDGIIMSVEAVQEAQLLWETESPRHRSRLVVDDALDSDQEDEAAEDVVQTADAVESVEEPEAEESEAEADDEGEE